MYWSEVAGGVLIGVASLLPLFFRGRIAGVSGYAASALRGERSSICFVAGLVLAGFFYRITIESLPMYFADSPLWLWPLAGLLVGFGSRLGGGCTSGHGVCGLGRGSMRSLVAVLCFMATAMCVATVKRLLAP